MGGGAEGMVNGVKVDSPVWHQKLNACFKMCKMIVHLNTLFLVLSSLSTNPSQVSRRRYNQLRFETCQYPKQYSCIF